MGQIQFTTSLVMIALFSIAIIGFAIHFAQDNSSYIDIRNDSSVYNLKAFSEGNLSDFRGGSSSTYQSIVESSITQADTTPSGGQFAITPTSIIGTVKNILQVGYVKIFGNNGGFGIFITTFFSLIGFIIGLLIWKTWGGRNPD